MSNGASIAYAHPPFPSFSLPRTLGPHRTEKSILFMATRDAVLGGGGERRVRRQKSFPKIASRRCSSDGLFQTVESRAGGTSVLGLVDRRAACPSCSCRLLAH